MRKDFILVRMINIIKKLIRYYQLLLAIEKNKPHTVQTEIAGYIREKSRAYDIDENLALRVARCESEFDPFAINFNKRGSIDRGLYQWNDYYHPEVTDEMAFNYKIATLMFLMSVQKGHLDWWNASKK